MRRCYARTLALLAGVLVLAATSALGQSQGRQPPSGSPTMDPLCTEAMRADARLNDVCFVSPQLGWAVGDRGTIWHTEDGGKSWYLQESGVACHLESVFFLNAKLGWAAGGSTQPYTHTSSGVVLLTRDGGRHWSRDRSQVLPTLKQVRFFDEKRGWAIGYPSAMFPVGLFVSEDGGRGWTPLPGEKTAGYLAADFLGRYNGAMVGRKGIAATVRSGAIEPARTLPFGLRSLTRLKLVPPTYGWLIGQGGLVMLTGDLGTTWQTPQADLPDGMIGQFDFAALEVRGPKAWIAGAPGTRILHSPDAGHSWTVFTTGQLVPIRALAFADDEHGWAVGELGLILATGDGGKSWVRQHSGGTRAALLGLFSEPKDVPLELFARLSGNEGYLSVVDLLNRRDWELPEREEAPADDRLREAVVNVGASGLVAAWQFPLRQPGLGLTTQQIVQGWDLTNDNRGLEMLTAHLVRQIRLWRPEVVVTHDASPQGNDPLGHLINQAVLQAVEQAQDPTSFAEQISRAGLEPWKVQKVYAKLRSGAAGTTTIVTAQLAARLGRSLADVSAGPRGLIEEQFSIAPETIGFRLLVDRIPQEQGRRDFFSGIVLQPGGDARRQLTEPPTDTLQVIQRMAQKRRNMDAILERTDKDPQQGTGLGAQVAELTRGLDPDGAGHLLYHLAQRYYHSGQWGQAAETFALLVDRYPEHPLTPAALVWLVQYYASSEAAWRLEGPQRRTVQQWRLEEPQQGAVQQTAAARAIDFTQQENRPERAAAFARQLAERRPQFSSEPNIGFSLAAADRDRGSGRQAERFYLSRTSTATRDAWWACAEGEQWLANRARGVPPKPILPCVRAASKPRLDGRLDDPLWQQTKPVDLTSPYREDGDWGATAMLAYDNEFLYLAVRCRQAPGAKYASASGPRPRDPDLSAQDRVELLVDLDRDFTTYYRLAIDQRGYVREDCWGDVSWNPQWFVTAATADGVWSAEAVIPLEQLTGQYPAPNAVWAVGLQRIVPGVGFQSWNHPASAQGMPEGFGYLLFQ
ncbi:MAG: YCF48-related protein [Thermoguttaceae bacterium]